MTLIAELRTVSDAALERSRAASQLITAIGPLLDPTLPTPNAMQAARVQRAALKLVDTALEESGADATRYVGFGLAALYCGLQPDTFHSLCEKGKGPRCTIVEGNGLFTVAALDEWIETIRQKEGA